MAGPTPHPEPTMQSAVEHSLMPSIATEAATPAGMEDVAGRSYGGSTPNAA